MNEKTNASLGMVFPGQGSQSVGMLSGLAARSPEVKACFDQASTVLGYDLWAMSQQGPVDVLAKTVHTQPVMLAAGVAVWRVWCAHGGERPALMAGHSLGEYSALVCADAMSFDDAVRLVALRAQLMQEAVPEGQGGMAAILGMSDSDVLQLCREASDGDVLEAVNFNSPGQVVIAGGRAAIDRAIVQAPKMGAKRAILLPVSVPSHCALMRDAAMRLREALDQATIRPPRIPVLHNINASPAIDVQGIREALEQQLYGAVLWVDTVHKMAVSGCQSIIESGPGKVLSGLGKRVDKTLTLLPVYDEASLSVALDGHQG